MDTRPWGLGLLALALVGTGACQSKSNSSCDQAKLATLAEQLEAAEPEARVALVSEGLLAACKGTPYDPVEDLFVGITRPDVLRTYLRRHPDPVFQAARQRICPRHDELVARFGDAPHGQRATLAYDMCGFARYDLLDEAQLLEFDFSAGMLTWTTHDFLLTEGTPVEVAKTISRAVALAEVHGFGWLTPFRGQTLVAAPVATRVPEGTVVYVTTTDLIAQEQPLVGLESGRLRAQDVHGHVVVALFESLLEEVEKSTAVSEARGQPSNPTLIMVLDGRVPVSTVVDTLYTASRLKFTRFAFVVQPTYPVLRAIMVTAPQFGPEEPAVPFKVSIADDGYVVDDDGERVMLAKLDPDGTRPSAWDQAGLVVAVSEAVVAHPDRRRVVVTAEGGISTEVLLATFAALLGPGCDQHEPSSCLIPELVISAGAD